MEEVEQINLREEYYTDVHNMNPKWWMRWGIGLVFIIFSILLVLGYIIKYPDVIKSEFRLSANNPSVTLPISNGNQIKKIFKNNNSIVDINDHLILFENESKYEDVMLLDKELNKFSFDKDSILIFFDKYLNKSLQLGSLIEQNWTLFSNELLEYYKIKKLDSYKEQIVFIEKELSKQHQLRNHYKNLIITDNKQKELLKIKIETDSLLFSKGVISKNSFNNSKNNFLETKKSLEKNDLAKKRVDLEITRLKNGISNYSSNEIENLISRKLGIRKSLNQLRSSIDLWKRKHLLISPITGSVNFIQDIKIGGFYEGNVLIVSPKNQDYYASIKIPFAGAGKAKISQKTILKFSEYPYREYGVIESKLYELNSIAGENFYLGKVKINNSEKISSYNKKIMLRENMSGIGEIITNDRSILERLFEKITYVFHKS
jgi:hypothetical protein